MGFLRWLDYASYRAFIKFYDSKFFAYVCKFCRIYILPILKLIYKYINLFFKKTYAFLHYFYKKFRKSKVYYYIEFYVEQLLKIVTMFLYFGIVLGMCIYTGIDQGLRFCWLFFIWYPYVYLNTNYQVKARSIKLFWYLWDKLKQFGRVIRFIYRIFKLVYVFIFYKFFVVFYVEIPWRPRNLLLKKTYGRVLRYLELFFDLLEDFVLFFWYLFRLIVFKIWILIRDKKLRTILRLRRKWQGHYWMKYMAVRFYVRFFLFYFFFWYSFYFLDINAAEIGEWWAPWSIPSFCLFVTIYWFYYWYLLTIRWRWRVMNRIGKYFKEHLAFFWCIVLMTWMQGQYADPETWGIPPTKFLKMILSFWF